MSDLLASLIIAVVQGIAEWFPISSSGHLVLFSYLLDYKGSLQFDVALHFGTLMAVFVYFGKDIVDIIEALLKGRWASQEARMGLLLIVASIPAAIIGFFFERFIEQAFSSLGVVALGFGITALLLFIASLDFNGESRKIGYWQALVIGVSQAFAILPGISRSGSTISAGLLLGLDEKSAVKFSFLMSIPVVFGAGIVTIGNERLSPDLIWATFAAFIAGLATIHLLLKIIIHSKKNLRWFGAYALLLALGLGIYLIFF